MLRAFYRKLENMPQDEDVIGLKNQLAPCIWDTDKISQKVLDKSKIHILSQTIEVEDDNKVFHRILETGEAITTNKDNYSKNYLFFQKKCDDYAQENPMQWKNLWVTFLKRCIILPIECTEQETALTIFSTLNNRGKQLLDSDIFKAQLYHNCKKEKRKEFTQIWKELTQICRDINFKGEGNERTVDSIFRYYAYVLRVKKEDKSYIREVALRRFYTANNNAKLKENNLINEIVELAKFWSHITKIVQYNKNQDEKYPISTDNLKYLHCLFYYPNEYWKFVVSVFFIKNKDTDTFDENLKSTLKKLISLLFHKQILEPGINSIKEKIFTFCMNIYYPNKLHNKFTLDDKKEDLIKLKIDELSPSSKISKALLLLDAYLNPTQEGLIQEPFDIEHIFPKKWQNTNYNGWNEKDAQDYLEKFGNKVVIEKKLNIQAGNGYFRNKKEKHYQKSNIANVSDLGKYHNDDWTKSDIEEREEKFKKRILNFFKGQEEYIKQNSHTYVGDKHLIFSKIEKMGVPLRNWGDIEIHYGIATGCDEAFIISEEKRQELIKEDPNSNEILVRILRGRDIKRYSINYADLWLINTHNGIKEKGIERVDIDKYPAVKRHLDNYSGINRKHKGDTPYNIASCTFISNFYKQKIVYQLTQGSNSFALDSKEKYFVSSSGGLITGNHLKYLLSFLNSKLIEYYFNELYASSLCKKGMHGSYQNMMQLPIPKPTKEIEQEIETLVDNKDYKKIDLLVYEMYGLNEEETNLIENSID